MQPLEQAVLGLEQALSSPAGTGQPRPHLLRQRLEEIRQALHAEHTHTGDLWLSARAGHLHRERNRLLARLQVLSASVSDTADLEPARPVLVRLVQDIEHHRQRVNDLLYDGLAMDVGGSE